MLSGISFSNFSPNFSGSPLILTETQQKPNFFFFIFQITKHILLVSTHLTFYQKLIQTIEWTNGMLYIYESGASIVKQKLYIDFWI